MDFSYSNRLHTLQFYGTLRVLIDHEYGGQRWTIQSCKAGPNLHRNAGNGSAFIGPSILEIVLDNKR